MWTSSWRRSTARTFVNLNPPVVAALEKAEALDPRLAKLLLPDRVHPDPLAHWVMAEAMLKGWNAPAVVSSVTIDASARRCEGFRRECDCSRPDAGWERIALVREGECAAVAAAQ